MATSGAMTRIVLPTASQLAAWLVNQRQRRFAVLDLS